jgi:hypothetical protein
MAPSLKARSAIGRWYRSSAALYESQKGGRLSDPTNAKLVIAVLRDLEELIASARRDLVRYEETPFDAPTSCRCGTPDMCRLS